MPSYRLYFLDGAGKVSSAEWLEADDDSSAIVAAQPRCESRRCELWLRQRIIASFGADGTVDRNGD